MARLCWVYVPYIFTLFEFGSITTCVFFCLSEYVNKEKKEETTAINKLNELSPQGKNLGKLTHLGRNIVRTNGDISVAEININGTINNKKLIPQAGFDFTKPCSTELKLINASIILRYDKIKD